MIKRTSYIAQLNNVLLQLIPINGLSIPSINSLDKETRKRIKQIQNEFVFGGTLKVHTLNIDLLTGVWSILRASLLSGNADRVSKALIAGMVSRENIPTSGNLNKYQFEQEIYSEASFFAYNGLRSKIALPDKYSAIAFWTEKAIRSSTSIKFPFSPILKAQYLGSVFISLYLNRISTIFLTQKKKRFSFYQFFTPLLKQTIGYQISRKIRDKEFTNYNTIDLEQEKCLLHNQVEFEWAITQKDLFRALSYMDLKLIQLSSEYISKEVQNSFKTLLQNHVRFELKRKDYPALTDIEFAQLKFIYKVACTPHLIEEEDFKVSSSSIELFLFVAWSSFQYAKYKCLIIQDHESYEFDSSLEAAS